MGYTKSLKVSFMIIAERLKQQSTYFANAQLISLAFNQRILETNVFVDVLLLAELWSCFSTPSQKDILFGEESITECLSVLQLQLV